MGHTGEVFNLLLETIGLGKWQIIQYVLLTATYLAGSHFILSILIIAFVPDFACLPTEYMVNGSISSNVSLNLTYGQSCEWHNPTDNTSQACNGGFVYAEPKEASIASEWDLVCGQAYLIDLSQTMLDVGGTIGTIIFTAIADKYGRRKVILWAHLGFLLMSLANCLSSSIIMFIVFRFFQGTLMSGTALVGWVITTELFTAKHRTLAILLSNVIWGLSTCFVSALGYSMKGMNWRYVQLAMCTFSSIIIGQCIFVDEPLKWLVANGRLKEAMKIVKKAAKMNGVNSERISSFIQCYFPEEDGKGKISLVTPADTKVDTEKRDACKERKEDENSTNISPMALLRNRRLRTIFLVMDLAWFTNALAYIGLYVLSSQMSGNRYLNLFFSSVAELAAGVFLLPIFMRCGRRKMMIALHLVGAVFLASAAILHVTTEGRLQYIVTTCAVIVGKFCTTGTTNLIYMFTPELYPTNIRSSGLGITSLFGRLGAFLSPFTATVARQLPWAPAAVFGGFCLLVAITSPLLPETKGKPLPQTLEDLEKLYSAEKNKNKTEIEVRAINKLHTSEL